MVSYVLVHGAANGPWVFDGWADDLGGFTVTADLRPRVGPRTRMVEYTDEVARVAGSLPEPPVVVGWSLGGLAALMAARRAPISALVLLEPSAPAEVIGHRPELPLREGLFGPEAYGVTDGTLPPAGLSVEEWRWVLERSVGARESQYARDERLRGIAVGPIGVPILVVHGDVEPNARERGPAVATALGGQSLEVSGASHWALVVGERYRRPVRGAIRDWVARNWHDRRKIALLT